MRHSVIITENGRFLVCVEINSSMTFLMDHQMEELLDAYSEQYAYPREGLKGYYVPLINVNWDHRMLINSKDD